MNTKTEDMALSPKHTLMDENTSKGNAILRGYTCRIQSTGGSNMLSFQLIMLTTQPSI